MAINAWNDVNKTQRRKIRYTQFISSMLAGTNGTLYQNVNSILYNAELVPPPVIGGMPNGTGVAENMPSYGTTGEIPDTYYPETVSINNQWVTLKAPTRDKYGNHLLDSNEISLQKRWRQARSLTTHHTVTNPSPDYGHTTNVWSGGSDHPQSEPFYGDTKEGGADPNDPSITHGDPIDASDTSNNGKFAQGPYRMSDFFGFSKVDLTPVYQGQYGQDFWGYTVNTEEDGFSTGMMMIANTDDGHPNDSTWFLEGDQFPTGAVSDPSAFPPVYDGQQLVYAGGPGTDFGNDLAFWADLGLDGAINGFTHGGFLDALLNPSRGSLKLHLGPGIDYFYIRD